MIPRHTSLWSEAGLKVNLVPASSFGSSALDLCPHYGGTVAGVALVKGFLSRETQRREDGLVVAAV